MTRTKHPLHKYLREITGVLVLLGIVAVSLAAQTPILEFSFESDSVTLAQAGSTVARLRVENISPHEADNLEITRLAGPVDVIAGDLIEVLGPFSDTLLEVPLAAGSDAQVGEALAQFELIYTYCIGDLCFQIVDEISLRIDINAPETVSDDGVILDPIEPTTPAADTDIWKLVLPVGLGLLLALALAASRMVGRRWWVLLLLVGILAAGLGVGFSLKQDQQAQSIGAVLCTSCVGIEETPHLEAQLSDEGQERVMALTREIELLLFSAPWCHACPYAKALVNQVAAINPAITVEVIDVDVDRDAARRYGIMQSGRTIVPAVLRVDMGQVLFGIEDLESRLLALLEETP